MASKVKPSQSCTGCSPCPGQRHATNERESPAVKPWAALSRNRLKSIYEWDSEHRINQECTTSKMYLLVSHKGIIARINLIKIVKMQRQGTSRFLVKLLVKFKSFDVKIRYWQYHWLYIRFCHFSLSNLHVVFDGFVLKNIMSISTTLLKYTGMLSLKELVLRFSEKRA